MTAMVLPINDAQDLGVVVATSIRNTFIDCPKYTDSPQRRNKSLPPSFSPTSFATWNIPPRCSTPDLIKEPKCYYDADDSTDARTEASDPPSSSDVGALSSHNASSVSDIANYCEPCAGTEPQVWYSEVALWAPMTPTMDQTGSVGQWGEYAMEAPLETPRERSKLSSKSVSFQPQMPAQPSVNFDKDGQVSEVLEDAKALVLERSQKNIVKVDLSHSDGGWALVIEPDRRSRVAQQQMVQSMTDSLLVAAERSRNVYVLGYCSPASAFQEKPQGAQAMLAVMSSTSEVNRATCWQLLKQGSCKCNLRQDWGTSKQHPALQVPVRIYVESIKLAAPAQVLCNFKQEAASILMMVVAMLTQSFTSTASAAGAQSFADEDGQGYRVEICVREDDMYLREHYLSLAKHAITEVMKQAKTVHLLGQSEPYIPKSNGFSVRFGEMNDQSQACWDVYLRGVCWRGEHTCRWQHPQCSLPVNVVLKTPKAPSESSAKESKQKDKPKDP